MNVKSRKSFPEFCRRQSRFAAFFALFLICLLGSDLALNNETGVEAETTPAATASPQQTPAPSPQNSAPSPQPADQAAVADRQHAVVQHLSAVIRFYHDAEAPIQKVGEPSDLVYRAQAVTLASQIAGFAFQSAKAEAVLADRSAAGSNDPSGQSQSQKLQAMRDGVAQQITTLKTQQSDLDTKLESARAANIPALKQQREQIEGELELQTAMADALGKITGISGASRENGFPAQIDQLESSVPGLLTGKTTTVAPTLDSLSAARSAGVTSQGRVLFELLGTRQDIENLIKEANTLHQQATNLRTPLIAQLRSTIARGETLSQQASTSAPAPSAAAPAAQPGKTAAAQPAAALAATKKTFDTLTAEFKTIAGASVPLSQEIMGIEQSQASLRAWHRAVNEEYRSILSSLLVRVFAIAMALFVIFALGEVWRRATTRYVHDVRRRRQFLVIRRLVIGFLSGLVMIFGLVTQFSSLATFAGFITAGIAVGLQTILLSVAAYFFIIGRFGVRVGDRITIAGVTGEVAEVGLVRFYVMELAGSGIDLYPSGRIAVFSNAVLFQAATPLFKQMPGTNYLWHEMTVKLAPDADYRPAVQTMLKSVQDVYSGYSKQINQQQQHLDSWMDIGFDSPSIQSGLQLADGGPQFWSRFPVLISQTREIDDRMAESLLQAIAADPMVKAAVSEPPVIKASVKG